MKENALKSSLISIFLLLFCFYTTGCEPKKDAKSGKADATQPTDTTPAATAAVDEPFDELTLLPPDMKSLSFEEVSIPMKDHLVIYGRLYGPWMQKDLQKDLQNTQKQTEKGADKTEQSTTTPTPTASPDQSKANSSTGTEPSVSPTEKSKKTAKDSASSKNKKSTKVAEGNPTIAVILMPVKPHKRPDKPPLVILLHGLDEDHLIWSNFPAKLVKEGYAVFDMDLRGHGKSTMTTAHTALNWRMLESNQWQLLPADILQVIRYFQKGDDYPQIDGKQVALIGEKLGASVAMMAGQKMNDHIQALILISPGLHDKGLIPSQNTLGYLHPVLLIANQSDPDDFQATQLLYNCLLSPKTLQIYRKFPDGLELFKPPSVLQQQISDWLIQTLPAT